LRGIAVRKNGVASLTCGDEAILRAKRAKQKSAEFTASSALIYFWALGAQLDLLRFARSDG
jgi:hypothetical protein